MKDKIIMISFILIIFSFSIFLLFKEERLISKYERRKLITKNELKEDIINNLDDYLTDQFPFRDNLISISTAFNRYILGNIENNDVYILDNHIIPKNYPLNEQNIENFISKINYINEKYLNESNVFYTIIPDKSYFLKDKKYLKIDFNKITNNLKKNINIQYIDIIPSLELEDYYYTDIHIKQPSYLKIIEQLNNFMNFNYQKISYKKNEIKNFYGASYSKVPSFIKPDNIIYLTNNHTKNAKVNHLEYGIKDVYDMNKINEIDMYDIFLSGPSAFIEIENSSALSDKELIIFRDSFGSSLTPLLIPFYKKIITIDLRYINMNLVKDMLEFKNKDVLFIYSTLIINNSNILKISY